MSAEVDAAPLPSLRCLWLTRFVPFPPMRGGDAIYSRKLIEALVAAGSEVTVLCHSNNGDRHPQASRLGWTVVPFRDRGRARSLLSTLPSIAYRFSTPEIRAAYAAISGVGPWDAVLIDTLAMADVLDLREPRGVLDKRTKLVYLSNNHEASLRRLLAAATPRVSISRLGLTLDAAKAAALERRLVFSADLVTATTSVDAELFRSTAPERRILVLSPGYDGPVVQRRTIDHQTPRRVMLLGSYGWVAKQLNLHRFLGVAAEPFADENIGIDVVGTIPDDYARRVRADFPSVTVTGAVADLAPHFDRARIGIIAEEIGGGFKLKALDYVFNRLPIVALSDSVAGMPLLPGHSILEFDDVNRMVEGIVDAIDDFARLNALHQAAMEACAHRFDWLDRGRQLASALAGMTNQ